MTCVVCEDDASLFYIKNNMLKMLICLQDSNKCITFANVKIKQQYKHFKTYYYAKQR